MKKSEIEKLIEVQHELNIFWASATPQQKAAVAKAGLREMPGQAYLFTDPATQEENTDG